MNQGATPKKVRKYEQIHAYPIHVSGRGQCAVPRREGVLLLAFGFCSYDLRWQGVMQQRESSHPLISWPFWHFTSFWLTNMLNIFLSVYSFSNSFKKLICLGAISDVHSCSPRPSSYLVPDHQFSEDSTYFSLVMRYIDVPEPAMPAIRKWKRLSSTEVAHPDHEYL
jgi:hypothetical protein